MSKTQYRTLVPISLAHSFGTITSIVIDYFKSKFPENYFKREFVNTEMSLNGLRKIRSDIMRVKAHKPILIVQPVIDFNDMPEFINNNIMNSTLIEIYDNRRPSYDLMGVFQDYERDIYLQAKVSRYKIRYEFTIILETDMQAINVCNYLMSTIRHEHPFRMGKMTEIEVPNFIINQLSSDSEIPIINPELNSRGEFLTYLNSNSHYPFLYKFQTSTGNPMYFLYVDNTLTLLFNDKPSMDRSSRNNMIKGTASITESLNVEFNTISTFYYTSGNEPITKAPDLNDIITNTTIIIDRIPMIELTKTNELGWRLYSSVLYEVEDVNDRVSIRELIDADIIKCIDYNKENGVDNNIFLDIRIVNGDGPMPIDDYSFDWDTYELVTSNNKINTTYRIAIYVNSNYVNMIKKNRQ